MKCRALRNEKRDWKRGEEGWDGEKEKKLHTKNKASEKLKIVKRLKYEIM